MKPCRFSPIQSEEQLHEAIRYTHLACYGLLKESLGRYLPVAGIIGIFCHDEEEYAFLTGIRERLTDASDHWQGKYYRLHDPIIFAAEGDIPETTYTHLYIRRPDYHTEVGDVDYVLDEGEYFALKDALAGGVEMPGMRIWDRPGHDLIKLADPEIDVLSFIGIRDVNASIQAQNTLN